MLTRIPRALRLQLVCVDFTATWCGPCQRIGPEFVKMADAYPDCVFIKVDVDENEVLLTPFHLLFSGLFGNFAVCRNRYLMRPQMFVSDQV
jgi:thiol-disulfide isomerase/thioredoxin